MIGNDLFAQEIFNDIKETLQSIDREKF